ncbi:zinc ribbon domain-containing protein [Candidatus Dojkabacteria bacterium]|nr:zinc ribbon domain-containing protein [Candidatus Dojkabacteria bacterium]
MKYDYVCQSCKHEFEVELKLSELGKKKIVCPKCKSPDCKKIIKPVSIGSSGCSGACATCPGCGH